MSDNFNRKRELVDGDDVERAEQLLRVLFAPPPLAKQVVLHGDLVPANVVRAGRSWRVIDPRPCRGEPAYDAGYWAVFSGYGRGARANVTLLAEELHLDEQHVLAWSWGLAVHRLLQIVDSTDPGHPPLVTELRQFIDEARSDVAV